MRLSPVIAAIAAAAIYRDVIAAADIRLAMDGRIRVPAAYVLPARESAGPNRTGTRYPITQRVTHEIQVVSIVDLGAGTEGGDVADRLDAVRRPLITALSRWQHPDADLPCRHLGGQLVAVGEGDDRLWWGDRFELAFTRRVTPF